MDDGQARFFVPRPPQVLEDVLAEHDPHIDDGADGDGDPGEGHHVGIDPEYLHPDEGEEHCGRKHERDQKRAPQMEDKQEDDDDGEEDLLGQGGPQGLEGLVDQARPIIEGDDGDLAHRAVLERLPGKARGYAPDRLLQVLDRLHGVGSVARHHNAPDGLGPGLVQHAAPEGRAQPDLSHLVEGDGDVAPRRDGSVAEVIEGGEESAAANHVLHPVDLDRPGPDVEVGFHHRLEHLVEADAEGPHGVGIDIDLVLLEKAADGGDLGHPLRPLQGVAHVEVLDAAQLLWVPAACWPPLGIASLEGVPEDLAEGGGVGSEGGADPRGEGAWGKAVELLQDLRPRPVPIRILPEDEVDAREAEIRVAPDGFHLGYAEERGGEGEGDLVLDILRGSAHPTREHNLLVLSDVGDGVHGDGVAFGIAELPVEGGHEDAPGHHHERDEQDDELVVQTERDEARDLGLWLWRGIHEGLFFGVLRSRGLSGELLLDLAAIRHGRPQIRVVNLLVRLEPPGALTVEGHGAVRPEHRFV